MARAKLPQDTRSKFLHAVFTPSEEQEVRKAAGDMMMSVSTFIRWTVLVAIRETKAGKDSNRG
jgi:hypothetical protein